MSQLWGEIDESGTGPTIVPFEQIAPPQPLPLEGSSLQQPSPKLTPDDGELSSKPLFSVDPFTAYTIKLLQYIRTLKNLIHNGQQAMENYKLDDTAGTEPPSLPDAPPIPQDRPLMTGNRSAEYPPTLLPYTPLHCTDFMRGFGTAPPEIDDVTCTELLRKSVATICVHAGYEVCSESVLRELVDMTKLYMTNITRLLRRAVDAESTGVQPQYQDRIDQVLHECGAGGVIGIHEFYNQRIIKYQQHLYETAERLVEEYRNIQSPANADSNDIKTDDFGDIRFPNSDDEGGDEEGNITVDGNVSLDVQMTQEGTGHVAMEHSPTKRHNP